MVERRSPKPKVAGSIPAWPAEFICDMDAEKILLIIIAGVVLVSAFVFREKITVFVGQVIVELKKVSWPTRKELIDATWIVLISSIIMTLFIGGTDFVLSKFLSILISR